MSLKSWRAEFYPVRAIEVPAEQAVQHSLQKWEGLRAEALTKHGLTYKLYSRELVDPSEGSTNLAIDGRTCALCQHYEDEEDGCPKCPLKNKPGTPSSNFVEPCGKHYLKFVNDGDPEPMIVLLKSALPSEENKDVA